MPGPKMGPRPRDFDEELVRRSPTFRKWEGLLPGAKLRYACREFVKGQGDDEERLMRRIMIARRNNVRDHQALKWARRKQSSVMTKDAKAKASPSLVVPASAPQPGKDPKAEMSMGIESSGAYNAINSRSETEAIISRTSHLLPGEQEPPPGRRSRRPTTLISDEAIKEEMDVAAVESTRSYKTWLTLPNGAEFLYNQKYIKGHEAHDWLLKKNIWRRMRYRRENKKMVEEMLSRERRQPPPIDQQQQSRKRRHDSTAVTGISTGMPTSTVGSDNRDPRVEDLERIVVDSSIPAMVVNTRASTTLVLGLAPQTDANQQEVVASTASEIVDHALLSTNSGVVVSNAPIVPHVNATAGDALTMSIGDPHHQQQQHQQQHALQNDNPPVHALHHQHPNQHHHDATESAAAYAASIALAGVGIGTDGDPHHDTVEAAVIAALAVTDAKSNAYHHQHLSHAPVGHHHAGLMHVDHVVHGGSDPLVVPEGRGLHSSEAPTSATTTAQQGLGLALDAAAKLAAAAAVTSDEVVLAATEAVTAVNEPDNDASSTGEIAI